MASDLQLNNLFPNPSIWNEYLENVVGVEINFNQVFDRLEKLRSVEEILGEIVMLDELRKLENLIIDL